MTKELLQQALEDICNGAPTELPDDYDGDNSGDIAWAASQKEHFRIAEIARAALAQSGHPAKKISYCAWADFYVWQSGKKEHSADCATSRAPAYMPGPCDCILSQPVRISLQSAAQAVLDRWNSPQWEWAKHGPTADLMHVLYEALAQTVQPAATLTGWQLVPVEPTPEIIEVICSAITPCAWPEGFDGRAQKLRRDAAYQAWLEAVSAAPCMPPKEPV